MCPDLGHGEHAWRHAPTTGSRTVPERARRGGLSRAGSLDRLTSELEVHGTHANRWPCIGSLGLWKQGSTEYWTATAPYARRTPDQEIRLSLLLFPTASWHFDR